MDFKNNNGQDPSQFLAKIKKQSKRLLQMCKEQPHLNITNLSSAQELLAQINGYPDWHAMQKSVTQQIPSQIDNNTRIVPFNKAQSFIRSSHDSNVTFTVADSKIKSVLEISYIDWERVNIPVLLDTFNKKFQFQFNMNIHKINIVLHQTKGIEKSNIHKILDSDKIHKLSPAETEELFTFQKGFSKIPKKNIDLKIFLVLESSEGDEENHTNFVNSFFNNSQLNVKTIDNFSDIILEENHTLASSKLRDELIYLHNISFNVKKWIYLLHFLKNNEIEFKLNININDGTISYTFKENPKLNLSLFIDSIIKTKEFPHTTLYHNNNDEIVPENNGDTVLSFPSLIHNRDYKFTNFNKNKTTHSTLVSGGPGSNSSTLVNLMLLNSLVGNNTYRTGIIDIYNQQKPVIDMLKNIYPEDKKHMIQSYDVTDSTTINIFDLPFGQDIYTNEDVRRIRRLLIPLFHSESTSFNAFDQTVTDTILYFNNYRGKRYSVNESLEIYRELQKNNIEITPHMSWKTVRDSLFLLGKIEMAHQAHLYSMHTLKDFMQTIPSSVKDKELYKPFIEILKSLEAHYPHFFGSTNINTFGVNVAHFNLSPIIKNDMNINFILTSLMNIVNNNILNNDPSQYPKNFPIEWINNPPTHNEFKNHENIKDIYSYYRFTNDFNKGNYNQLVVENIDYLFKYQFSHDILMKMRESRKFNLGITVSTQNVKKIIHSHSELLMFVSTFFTANPQTEEERDILKTQEIPQNLLDIIKKTYNTSWIVQSRESTGIYLDAFTIQINDLLAIALDPMKENMKIKENLFKTNSFFNAISKIKNSREKAIK